MSLYFLFLQRSVSCRADYVSILLVLTAFNWLCRYLILYFLLVNILIILIWLCRYFPCSIGGSADYDGGRAIRVYGFVRHPSERCPGGDPDRQCGDRGGVHRPHSRGKSGSRVVVQQIWIMSSYNISNKTTRLLNMFMVNLPQFCLEMHYNLKFKCSLWFPFLYFHINFPRTHI